jgi:hypothetical protein
MSLLKLKLGWGQLGEENPPSVNQRLRFSGNYRWNESWCRASVAQRCCKPLKLRRNIDRNTGNRDSEEMVAVLSDLRATTSASPMGILNSYQGRSRCNHRLFERNWLLTPSRLKLAIANPLIRHHRIKNKCSNIQFGHGASECPIALKYVVFSVTGFLFQRSKQ